MAEVRYPENESMDRIYRLLTGESVSEDVGTLTPPLYASNESLSLIAELLAGTLSGKSLQLRVPFTLAGDATVFEDMRIDGMSTRVGVVAPTDEVGFLGNDNFSSRNFVNNQADEVQFAVQLPHAWKEGGQLYPHVHFSPWITNAGNAAARFVLEYSWANINGSFPTGTSTYTMTQTWTGNKQWSHLIASNSSSLTTTGKTVSSVLKCRLYRDNTVSDNLAGKVALLYIDFHYEIDGLGSSEQYQK